MSSTQHQLIEQCATRLRGIVDALDNIHDTSPHRWSTDLDDVHSSAESLLALIKDQAPTQAAQDLAFRTIAEYPCPEQDNMTAANMRQVAADAITGALAFGAQASQPPAEDHWLRPFYDIGRAEGQRTQELAMLVRMLASSLKRHAPESNLVARATNYLAAKGLAGTPLRDAPASVEQAGGDERAAFELFVRKHCGMPEHIAVNWDDKFTNDAWEGWQARAALAPPSPKREQRLVECDACPTSGGCVEKCMKAPTQLSPAQAEAERPEVDVTRILLDIVPGDGDGDGDGDGHEVYAKSVADVEAKLAADGDRTEDLELKLHAALARVAELERQEPVVRAYGVLPPFAEKVLAKLRRFYDCAEDFESGGVDIGRHWLDLLTQLGLLNRVQRSPALWEISQHGEDLLEAPVAQAQHSVPEGWMLVECGIWTQEQVDEMQKTVARFRNSEFVDDRALAMAVADAGQCKAPEISLAELLAAAPGKEVPQAWIDVQAERRRQITAEGWTPEHDDEHADGQMAQAAGCYALHAGGIGTDWPDGRQNGAALFWPWDKDSWKPTTPRRDLVKACALALAEIERLDRAGISQSPQPGATTASS
ncbi:hypothetical protein [Pseudomonas aeruginosa]|uniref:hypothetical protein n=1 Tax=Pseudomonas aeruginosa TaxID=287 RepID=UPI002156FB5D|nr:hypothetical protein [Pseudomonas aeruginosa]